jgi:hypothetical protein
MVGCQAAIASKLCSYEAKASKSKQKQTCVRLSLLTTQQAER